LVSARGAGAARLEGSSGSGGFFSFRPRPAFGGGGWGPAPRGTFGPGKNGAGLGAVRFLVERVLCLLKERGIHFGGRVSGISQIKSTTDR